MHALDESQAAQRDELLRKMAASRAGIAAGNDASHPVHPDDPPHPRGTGLTDHPAYTVAEALASAWWRKHPLRETVTILENNTRVLVQPVANGHPYTLLAASAALGALAVYLMPSTMKRRAVPFLTAQAADLAKAAGTAFVAQRIM